MKNYKATQLLTFTLNKKIHYITKGSIVELEDCDYVDQLVFKGYLVEVQKDKVEEKPQVKKQSKTKK